MRRAKMTHFGRDHMDRREKPIYSVEEAAGFLGIPRNTMYAWTLGRRKANTSNQHYPSVLELVDRQTGLLSFYDLAEAHILRSVAEQNVPLKKIKKGLEYLRSLYPHDRRPLLTWDFYTDRKHLFVGGMLGSKDKDREALVDASQDGQLVITKVIEEYLELIHRDSDRLPDMIFPKAGKRIVAIASGVVAGRPTITDTRIPTSIIAQRFRAGESEDELAQDYKLAREAIVAAIQYERAA